MTLKIVEFGPSPIYAHGSYLSPNGGVIMMIIVGVEIIIQIGINI